MKDSITKIELGSTVCFVLDGIEREGVVYVFDTHGTVESSEPSCDIFVEAENMLYKHVPLSQCFIK